LSATPIRPLPARSVLLSVLLGSHPPQLPVRVLVRTAVLFGIADGTARVALSRLGADGEVVSDGGTYGLSERHLARQRGQDAALRPPTRVWEGSWELLAGDGRAAALAADRRLGRLRPGLWARPDNLTQPRPEVPAGAILWRASVVAGDPVAAGELWDLAGWATTATELMAGLDGASTPAERLAVAAATVRHIRIDPLLPDELLPAGWPGAALRQAYDSYRTELGRMIAGLRDD
jgi:phenylacetic acid degradation operon negative regulatory protein